ncbi:hypothetical protein JHK82_018549 [Glycine max]|nr:hypothetical protein JHK82_018549 [Glycine max]
MCSQCTPLTKVSVTNKVRKVDMLEGVSVVRSEKVNDELILDGNDIELVSRKLRILKGVIPREPKKKFKGTHQTYYHVKNVTFLCHEPLVEIRRAIRVHERKIKKAKAKKNLERANRLCEKTPKPKIDRIIRQSLIDYSLNLRVPEICGCTQRLDGCLTMVHLFATLPTSESKKLMWSVSINVQDLYALSRYASTNNKPSVLISKALKLNLNKWRPSKKRQRLEMEYL